MPVNSSYPNGFPGGVSIRGVPLFPAFAGNVFWVDSARGGNGSKGTERQPLATLDHAIGRCTANNGDLIILAPNHAETITGAGGITADIAGVTVIGMGYGAQRPRFLMDGAATVTAVVSAADFAIKNCVFAAGHADIVRCFNITAAGFTAEAIEFVENVVDENFLIPFDFSSTTNGNANGASIIGCRSLGVDASATEFIAMTADCDALTVENNLVVQSGSTDGALIKQATGKDLTNLSCMWNFVQHAMTAGDLLIDNDTAVNTGIVAHNRCRHADVTGAHSLVDCDGVGLFDNLSVSTAVLSGFVVPAIDVDL